MEEPGQSLDGPLKKSASLMDITSGERREEEPGNSDPHLYSLKKTYSLTFRKATAQEIETMGAEAVLKQKPAKRSILMRKHSLPTSPEPPEFLGRERSSTNSSSSSSFSNCNLTDLVGQVLVKVLSAKDLSKKALGSNTFCEVSIGGRYARTAVVSKQQHPTWNETLTLFVEDLHAGGDLCVELYADDLLGRERLGSCVINLFQLDELHLTSNWYPLTGSNGSSEGSIRIGVLFRRLRETTSALDKDLYGFHIEPSIQTEFWEHMRTYYKKLDERRKLWNKSGWWKFKDVKEFRSFARKGFPIEHRGEIWQIICGSKAKLKKNSDYYFITLEQHKEEKTIHSMQIDKDLDRTFPHSILFQTVEGKDALRRVLRAFSYKNQSVGYCQSMNFICGLLLLLMDEEAVFWCLATIVEDLVPDYFDMSMTGAKADVCVFKDLAMKAVPKIMAHLENIDFDISVSTTPWFLCLFAGHLPTETLLRVFDVFLLEGPRVLHQVGMGLLKLNEAAILACQSFEDCFALMKSLPSKAIDADKLMKVALSDIQIQPKSKIRALKQMHCKKFEELKREKVFQELLHDTKYTEKELESLSRQFNAMVQITPDNQNLLMNMDTFLQVVMSIVRKHGRQDEEKEEEMSHLLSFVFNALDANSDGNIDFKEFIVAMHILRRGTHDEKIHLAFKAFDSGKTHVLVRSDVQRIVETMESSIPIDDELRDSIFEVLLQGAERVDLHSFTDRIVSVPVLESWLLEFTTIPE